MSDVETHTDVDDTVDGEEILDVTILDEDDEPIVESAFDRPGRWYIVHTFAGHEQKVIGALNNIIKSRELSESIYEIYLPEEDVTSSSRARRSPSPSACSRATFSFAASPTRDLLRDRIYAGRDRIRRRRKDQAHGAHPP